MAGEARTKGKSVKRQRVTEAETRNVKPVFTDAQKEAFRKARELVKKQAGVEAHAASKKYLKKLTVRSD